MTTGLVTVSAVFRRRDLVKHTYIHTQNTSRVHDDTATLKSGPQSFNSSHWSDISQHLSSTSKVPERKNIITTFLYCCCCSVTKSGLTLCDPMNCSTPGFPVLHYLPEFAQTHVHWVVMPSNHLILCHPLLLSPSINFILYTTQKTTSEYRFGDCHQQCNWWSSLGYSLIIFFLEMHLSEEIQITVL